MASPTAPICARLPSPAARLRAQQRKAELQALIAKRQSLNAALAACTADGAAATLAASAAAATALSEAQEITRLEIALAAARERAAASEAAAAAAALKSQGLAASLAAVQEELFAIELAQQQLQDNLILEAAAPPLPRRKNAVPRQTRPAQALTTGGEIPLRADGKPDRRFKISQRENCAAISLLLGPGAPLKAAATNGSLIL
jgi:hypothetical protein